MPRELSRPEQLLEGKGFTTKFYYLHYFDEVQFNTLWKVYLEAKLEAQVEGTELPKSPVPTRHPRVTVCLVMNGNTVEARGVAICTPPDNPSRKLGRKLAARRALVAVCMDDRHKATSVSRAAKHVLGGSKGGQDLAHRIGTGLPGFALSVRLPALTPLEERLITKPEAKQG